MENKHTKSLSSLSKKKKKTSYFTITGDPDTYSI